MKMKNYELDQPYRVEFGSENENIEKMETDKQFVNGTQSKRYLNIKKIWVVEKLKWHFIRKHPIKMGWKLNYKFNYLHIVPPDIKKLYPHPD